MARAYGLTKKMEKHSVDEELTKEIIGNGDLVSEGRTMPLTYCLCCAGHCRQHLERLLGIQLKTKEVVSSPINSNGQKPCEFVLEII